MNRRSLLAILSGFGASLGAGAARASTTNLSAIQKLKIVYHLNELDRVSFVLGNIQNHFDGVGGSENVTIALVVHGPGLKAFHAERAPVDIAQTMNRFAKAGMESAACGNTMVSQKVTLADLVPGFTIAERGGVVRIAELQAQGYLYLRP